jgi:hypothetical protein
MSFVCNSGSIGNCFGVVVVRTVRADHRIFGVGNYHGSIRLAFLDR